MYNFFSLFNREARESFFLYNSGTEKLCEEYIKVVHAGKNIHSHHAMCAIWSEKKNCCKKKKNKGQSGKKLKRGEILLKFEEFYWKILKVFKVKNW